MICDFSMLISEGTATYPTDPKIKVKSFLKIGENVCNLSEIHFGSHSGTHVDALLHFLILVKEYLKYHCLHFMERQR